MGSATSTTGERSLPARFIRTRSSATHSWSAWLIASQQNLQMRRQQQLQAPSQKPYEIMQGTHQGVVRVGSNEEGRERKRMGGRSSVRAASRPDPVDPSSTPPTPMQIDQTPPNPMRIVQPLPHWIDLMRIDQPFLNRFGFINPGAASGGDLRSC
jgi:hypothetical protein